LPARQGPTAPSSPGHMGHGYCNDQHGTRRGPARDADVFVLPLWLAAGFADYLCHRASHIEKSAAGKGRFSTSPSLLRWEFPGLAALFLEAQREVQCAGEFHFSIGPLNLSQESLWGLSHILRAKGSRSSFEKSVFVRKCVAPMRAFIVPNGCSTVSRRWRMASGFASSRCCTASSRCSCSHRVIRRSVVHWDLSEQFRQAVVE
jgi:hypothetical protein